jgi:hypothetical protein
VTKLRLRSAQEVSYAWAGFDSQPGCAIRTGAQPPSLSLKSAKSALELGVPKVGKKCLKSGAKDHQSRAFLNFQIIAFSNYLFTNPDT